MTQYTFLEALECGTLQPYDECGENGNGYCVSTTNTKPNSSEWKLIDQSATKNAVKHNDIFFIENQNTTTGSSTVYLDQRGENCNGNEFCMHVFLK